MKSIVIYNSKTGFTKKYAEWISEAAGSEMVEFAKAKKIKLSEYDAIVFGGWCMAGTISKLNWFKKKMPEFSGKKLIVYGVGASPAESPDIPKAVDKNFTAEELKQVKFFYCPGGLNYEKMGKLSKFLMGLLVSSLKKKENKTEDDIKQIEMLSHSYDLSDRKYIEGIVAELK